MYNHPRTIQVSDKDYCLSHMVARKITVKIPAVDGDDDNPSLKVVIQVFFNNHCYTEGVPLGDCDPKPLIFDKEKRRRKFCARRYSHSLDLSDILTNAALKNCLFTGKYNWLIVELKNENGDNVNYQIYFTIKKHRHKKNNLLMWVETAFVKDDNKTDNMPKRGKGSSHIKFAKLVRSTLIDQKIIKPRNF